MRCVRDDIGTMVQRLGIIGLSILFTLILCLSPASAQTTNGTEIVPPSFTVTDLELARTQLEDNANLDETQKTAATTSLDNAISAYKRAEEFLTSAADFTQTLESSPEMLRDLREDIKAAQKVEVQTSEEPETMTGENLLRLEQELISREVELDSLRSEAQRYETELQELLQNQLRADLSEAENQLNEVTNELGGLGSEATNAVQQARRYSLESRQYFLRAQIQSLGREITSLPARQLALGLRRDLANIRAQKVAAEVLALQDKTGRRRLSNAQAVVEATEAEMGALEKAHPFILAFAAENTSISHDLRDLAEKTSDYPRLKADARRRRDDVKNDLDVATQLTDLGQINRQSSATLRRLRNQRAPVVSVRSEINATIRTEIEATQKRLWANEQLRRFPPGAIDTETLMEDWRRLNPGSDDLAETDMTYLTGLYETRRNLLNDISEASFSLLSEADSLESIQGELLKHTTALSDLLDQKLLWLPSVKAIGLGWPEQVLRGTSKVFHLSNFANAGDVLVRQLRRYSLIILFFSLVIVTAILFRRRLREQIRETAGKVGRVQKDSYWHTPSVIIACAIISAPLPLIIFAMGVLFKTSSSPDLFVTALGQTGIELSGFLWFFLMWAEWNRDKSLFDAHYNLPMVIRHGVIRQLRWFIPFAAVTIAMVTLTQNSRETDIYEGFSLMAFIVTAGAFSFFGIKVLWAKRSAIEKAFADRDSIWRHRHVFTFIIVGLPIIAALLAASGYYDTARELLSRLFFSAGLMIATYATYGLIKRTVVVAQRRIALRQAMERREKILRMREEKEAAEERGDPPPPVDYEEIDLETLSRQSTQLLNTVMVLGFAALMWVFWQDLLPALSIFDEVELWSHQTTDANGITMNKITLWNLMQALVIVVLTFIASRNLPGFLEVFVLNRSKLDAGTRYAIVGVLGYIIIAIGIIMAFNRLGTKWSELQWVVAALGVGVGFGLQEIIANFISGLIILFERPVRVGDYVTIGDQSGTVTRIQIRATTLGDLDNREILIPNKSLITERVTNWTLSNSITRLIIKVGVAYGSDTDKARDTILDVVNANDRVLDSPKPQVLFLGFGDSSLDFEIRVFLRSFEDRFPVSHHLHTDINKALDKAGISIPFPQRDLHIITPKDPKLT